ncbi:tumor necrosis factor receptor superfamily member 16-like [Haliotis cracherodii]|uniref:tumor necrosis factor receptor superfamily member 16-like n=1 Tax=Haliotis cracherodii TaxID=6455 RepID=UPI0039E8EF8B
MSWICFLAVIVCCQVMVQCACEKDEYDLNGQQCCTRCPAGSGATQQCTVVNNTSCEQCAEGSTYSPHPSHSQPCLNCTKCPKDAFVKSQCNTTHDTVCECASEYFFSLDTGECKACEICPGGWGISVQCSLNQNSVCDSCPNGTFAREISFTEKCQPCTVCSSDQKMLQTCSPSQDTICLSVPIYSTNPGGKYHIPNEHTIQKEHKPREKDIDIIPLYCAILGAVVVGLLGYVILVHYRRMKEKRLVREPHEDVEYSKASGGDSGIYVEVEHQQKGTNCAIVTCATRIRDLPQAKKRELERCFSQSASQIEWRGLAKEIGFNSRKISGFESKSKQDSVIPMRHMIQEWSKSDAATVGVLIQALKNIGRLDVLRSMHIADSTELQPLNMNNPQHFVL